MKKSWGLVAFGLLLLATVHPLAADVIGRKTMERKYETGGLWCQIPYSYHLDQGDPRIGPISDLFVFTATGPTATIVFEVDNQKYHDSVIDHVVVAKSSAFDRQELWGEDGCFSSIPAFFDFTRLASDDPDLVFADSFVNGPRPEWAGLSPVGVHWIPESSDVPAIQLSPGQIDGGLSLGVQSGGPPTVKASLTLTNLVPGEEYGLSLWWRVSNVVAGAPAMIGISALDTPQLSNTQRRYDAIDGYWPLESWDYFYVEVPEGLPSLSINVDNFSGDSDLYVRHGGLPESSDYDCRSVNWDYWEERCVIASPAPGRWWIGVTNFDTGFTIDYSVIASWQAPLDFYALPPCRVLDTRQSPGFPLDSSWIHWLSFTGVCGVPDSARAVAVNLTVANPTGAGYLKVWPGSVPEPLVSSVNFGPGMTRSNNAIVGLSPDGYGYCYVKSFVANDGTVHLIVDVTGYFQ